MINYNFIKKKFNLRILFILFIFSLIFSLLITFMNPLKVYKLKIDSSKINYLNQLAQIQDEELFRSYNLLFIPDGDEKFRQNKFNIYSIDDIGEYLSKNYQRVKGNIFLVILRKDLNSNYYLDVIINSKFDIKKVVRYLNDESDKKIKNYFGKQYDELILYIENEGNIKNFNSQLDVIYLLFNEYQTICLNKKLPFINNFDVKDNFDLKKLFENISSTNELYFFLKKNTKYIANDEIKFCLEKFFFEDRINELTKNINFNHFEKIKLINKILFKRKLDMEMHNNILSFNIESEKYDIFYNLIQFLKNFILIIFILVILRISTATFIK
jgi:hypothetical protein